MSLQHHPYNVCPKQKADATLSQANPTSGDKYTVLSTARRVRVIGISVWVSWTVQPTPLEVHCTVDGQSYLFSIANPVNGTRYSAFIDERYGIGVSTLGADSYAKYRAYLFEGRSVKIEVETTGGTVSNISAKVVYAQW